MKISFIIPAYNEEKFLEITLNNLNEIASKACLEHEIIVVDNNSSDQTSHIAKNLGAQVVFQPIRSISKTRNAGAKAANGDTLIFVDADTLPSLNLLKNGIEMLDHYKVVTALTHLDKYHTFASLGVWLYNLLSYFFRLGNGQFIIITKKNFDKIGGFDEDIYGFEDIYFFKKAKRIFGFSNIKVLLQTINTSGRKFKKERNYTSFIFQLLGVLLNKPIGKDINKFDFWYNNKTERNNSYSYKNLVVLCLIILLICGKFISPDSYIYSYTPVATALIFILFTALNFNAKSFAIVTAFTFLIEIIGHKTGLIFGNYVYNEMHGNIGFFGVPIFIALAWYVLMTSLKLIFGNRLVASLAIVGVDILLENFAVNNNLWQWPDHAGLLTAPIQNYLAWFTISYLLFSFVEIKKLDLKYAVLTIIMLLCYINQAMGSMASLLIIGYSINKKINALSDFK